MNIRIELVDEGGNHINPSHISTVEYLSRFLNKCVVNKVYQKMLAAGHSGTILVYQDKIEVKEA
ncbi:MAG TPA: hypothetical protein VHC48_10175 [Puia sp.]|nr:hypothetical protein [Puia sp.]